MWNGRVPATGMCCLLLFVGATRSLANELPALLDAPALASSLAAMQPLAGVARAGERLVCVGRRGIIVYSDDRGAHWQQAKVPLSVDLTAVAFATPRLGWAVGHEGAILASSDAGETWTRQFEGRALAASLATYADQLAARSTSADLLGEIRRMAAAGLDQSFLDVTFENEKEGYAVGAFNLLYRTEDGGGHWQPQLAQTENPKFLHLYAIRRIGDDLYIAGEQGLVLKLDRTNSRFVARPTPYQGSFFGIVGDDSAVLAFGLRGNAWRSVDGGSSWQQVEAGPPVGITGGTVLNDGRWALVDLAGIVLMSNDHGATFAPAPIPPAAPYSGVADAGSGKLALAGWRGVVTPASMP